jgi:hypothetical protein
LQSAVGHEGIAFLDHTDDSKTFRCDKFSQNKSLNCLGSTDEKKRVDFAATFLGESAIENDGGPRWEAVKELTGGLSTYGFDESSCFQFFAEPSEFLIEAGRIGVQNNLSAILFFEEGNLLLSSHDIDHWRLVLLTKLNQHPSKLTRCSRLNCGSCLKCRYFFIETKSCQGIHKVHRSTLNTHCLRNIVQHLSRCNAILLITSSDKHLVAILHVSAKRDSLAFGTSAHEPAAFLDHDAGTFPAGGGWVWDFEEIELCVLAFHHVQVTRVDWCCQHFDQYFATLRHWYWNLLELKFTIFWACHGPLLCWNYLCVHFCYNRIY